MQHSNNLNQTNPQSHHHSDLQTSQDHANQQKSYKINLRSGIKNPLKSILLAWFNPENSLIVDGEVMGRIAFHLNRTPRTVRRQLATLGDCKYYRLSQNEQNKWVVTFSKQTPMLQQTCFPYRYMAVKHGLTAIQGNILAITKSRGYVGLRPLPHRTLAGRIGCDKQSITNGHRVLVKKGLLTPTYILADYEHPLKKKWRTVYNVTQRASATIRTLIISLRKKLQRILSKAEKTAESTAKESQNLVWFNKFKQKYPDSEDLNLATTLNAVIKRQKTVLTEADYKAAWEIFMQNPMLKIAVHIGFRDAVKACLVEKGGELNDSSSYWKGYTVKKINAYWFLCNIPNILAGKYDVKELSEKARNENPQAKYCGSTSKAVDNHTEYMGDIRPETPVDEWKAIIADKSTCREETALRMQLLEQHASYAYENWFAKCGWSKETGKLTHDSAFYRAEIKRKYGLYVSINTPTANPNVATNASGAGNMIKINGKLIDVNRLTAEQRQKLGV